jgi:hypothetical protein
MVNERIKANVLRKNPRNIPGRATGSVTFSIRWPGGKIFHRSPRSHSIQKTIAAFKRRLNQVAPDLLLLASAKIEAFVRNEDGLPRKMILAEWNATDSLDTFIATARSAWKQLPKEENDQNTTTPAQ